MAAISHPVRIDSALYEAAKSAGLTNSRSAAQQVMHWIRIGRELENAPTTRAADIRRVLAGDGGLSYDALNPLDQAVVRAEWETRAEGARGKLNFAEEFSQRGLSFSEADEQGNVVTHHSEQPK
ncbi:TA system antitoxin ParD family protein [Leucobacter sp. HY1908]